mgnify:CR=1 FL=1
MIYFQDDCSFFENGNLKFQDQDRFFLLDLQITCSQFAWVILMLVFFFWLSICHVFGAEVTRTGPILWRTTDHVVAVGYNYITHAARFATPCLALREMSRRATTTAWRKENGFSQIGRFVCKLMKSRWLAPIVSRRNKSTLWEWPTIP